MLIQKFLACAIPNGSLIMYAGRVHQVADTHTYVNLAMTSLDLIPLQGARREITGAHFQNTAIMEVHIPLM